MDRDQSTYIAPRRVCCWKCSATYYAAVPQSSEPATGRWSSTQCSALLGLPIGGAQYSALQSPPLPLVVAHHRHHSGALFEYTPFGALYKYTPFGPLDEYTPFGAL